MVDFKSAFLRPFTVPRRFALQSVLSIFPLSYVAFPLTWGYLFECIEASLAGEEDLPEWRNWIHLILNGLCSMSVILAYFLPGLILTVLAYPGHNPFDAADVPYLPVLVLGAALLLLASYVVSAAIVVAAAEGDWVRAFSLKSVFGVAFMLPYLVAFVASIALSVLVFGVLYWVGSWTFLSAGFGMYFLALIGGVLGAYCGIVSMTLFARAYLQAS